MITSGIVTVDLHGMNAYQAKIAIDAQLRRANGVYRLRVIHGCHHGTALREMVVREYGSHPNVQQLKPIDDATTDLVLREL